MKKFLVLTLVLSVLSFGSVSSGALVLEYRAADGVTPITEVNVGVDTNFTLALIDTYDGSNGAYRMYNVDANGGVSLMQSPYATDGGAGGGFFGVSAYSAAFDGVDIAWGDVGAQSGDVAIIGLQIQGGADSGTVTYASYESNYVTEIQSKSISVVPEPMTLSLLGLGGLALIRRRRA